jgi:nitrogen-specific signal transduction histidine kinase
MQMPASADGMLAALRVVKVRENVVSFPVSIENASPKRGKMRHTMHDDFSAPEQLDSNQLHQLKNRLTVVKGVAQLLDRQLRRDDWQREKMLQRVDRLQDEIASLEQLVASYEPDNGTTSGPADDVVH